MDKHQQQTGIVSQPGLSQSELVEAYIKRQNSDMPYDKQVEEGGYTGPKVTSECMARMVEYGKRKHFSILDVGAGTGLVGKELYKLGFENLHALEPSDAMLDKAEEQQVYRRTYKCFMTDKKTPELFDDQFDGLTTCGSLLENHLPIGSLDEMIRVVKPGGIIVIVARHQFVKLVFKGRLEEHMSRLEVNGKWKLQSNEVFPNYYLDDEGISWTYVVA